MTKAKVVAIDGPSGSGKSTLAKSLSQRMKFLYVDTGAMFRAVAVMANEQQRLWMDEPDDLFKKWLETLSFEYKGHEKELIVINQKNVTAQLRDHHVSEQASVLSKRLPLRRYLQEIQRQLVKDQFCVMEGRDIGTVIFPDSFCKIFLTAELSVRAKRRAKELQQRHPHLTWEQVQDDMRLRDERDAQRETAPLKKADDAIEVDSSHLSFEDELQHVVTIVQQAAKNHGLQLP
jgi:cytidylate kinase